MRGNPLRVQAFSPSDGLGERVRERPDTQYAVRNTHPVSTRDERPYDPRDERRSGRGREEDEGPRGPETSYRAVSLLDRILALSRNDDPRTINLMLLLRHQLETDE